MLPRNFFSCGVQSFSPVKRRVDGTRPWMRPVFPLPAPYRRKRNLFYGKWSVFRLMVDVFVPEIFSSPSEELFSLSGHKRKRRDHERFCRIDLEADGDGFPQDPFPVCRKADRRYIFDSPSFLSYKQCVGNNMNRMIHFLSKSILFLCLLVPGMYLACKLLLRTETEKSFYEWFRKLRN